jgi:hypothetical protein
MDGRFAATILAVVVAATLLGAPVTMADWGEQATFSVEPVERSQVDAEAPVLQYQNLSSDAQNAVRRAVGSPDGSHVVYGYEDAPDRFAYSDYTEPGYGLYVVVYGGDSYRLTTAAGGGFPFVYWLMELPFVGYGAVLAWAAHLTHRDRLSPRLVALLAGVGAAVHLLGPAFDFPVLSPDGFVALGVVAAVGATVGVVGGRRDAGTAG